MENSYPATSSSQRLKRKCNVQSQEKKFLQVGNNTKSSPPSKKIHKSKRLSVVPPPLRVSIPEEKDCKLSDDLADSVKTLCQICQLPITLTGMRSHTMLKHRLQITKYKELYGQFEIIEHVFHKCHLCGKIMLLDCDAMGGHIKGTHKMKEREYKRAFMTSSSASSVYSNPNPNQTTSTAKSNSFVWKKKTIGATVEYDFNTTFPDYEYSCTLRHCELCGHDEANIVSEIVCEDHKPNCKEHEEVGVVNPKSEDIERKDVMSESCKIDQFGLNRKVLVTDVLQGKDSKENVEGSDDNNSIDYSEESLIEDSDNSDKDSETQNPV